MLHRLVYDNLLDNEVADKYKSITVSTVAAKLGYGKELYFPTDEKSNISQQVNIFVKLKRWQKKVLFRKVKRKNF